MELDLETWIQRIFGIHLLLFLFISFCLIYMGTAFGNHHEPWNDRIQFILHNNVCLTWSRCVTLNECICEHSIQYTSIWWQKYVCVCVKWIIEWMQTNTFTRTFNTRVFIVWKYTARIGTEIENIKEIYYSIYHCAKEETKTQQLRNWQRQQWRKNKIKLIVKAT